MWFIVPDSLLLWTCGCFCLCKTIRSVKREKNVLLWSAVLRCGVDIVCPQSKMEAVCASRCVNTWKKTLYKDQEWSSSLQIETANGQQKQCRVTRTRKNSRTLANVLEWIITKARRIMVVRSGTAKEKTSNKEKKTNGACNPPGFIVRWNYYQHLQPYSYSRPSIQIKPNKAQCRFRPTKTQPNTHHRRSLTAVGRLTTSVRCS